MNVGDRVRIERDETVYPSKGTWPQFRGRTGTIVEINTDSRRPRLTEYAVVLGNVSPRTDGRGAFNYDAKSVAWFKLYEMQRVGSQRRTDGQPSLPPRVSTRRGRFDRAADSDQARVVAHV